jgi:hypothetical protein
VHSNNPYNSFLESETVYVESISLSARSIGLENLPRH